MRSREVPFDENAKCDVCGQLGAFDFMGDLICPKCAEEARDREGAGPPSCVHEH